MNKISYFLNGQFKIISLGRRTSVQEVNYIQV